MKTNFGSMSSKSSINLKFDVIMAFLGLFTDDNTNMTSLCVIHQTFPNFMLLGKKTSKLGGRRGGGYDPLGPVSYDNPIWTGGGGGGK